ncbi:hypothetical protein ES703_107437 [subsurface metagenome]
MDKSAFLENLQRQVKEILTQLQETGPIDEMFRETSDRAFGIVVACYLDNMLEKLIRVAYIKDPQVSSIFKNEQILQSFFAKINIAYFSGLIPKFVYHDLKLICEIRNRFAHEVIAELRFTNEAIEQRIEKCELRPRTLDGGSAPRLKFVIIATQIGSLLRFLEMSLSKVGPPKLMELFKLDEMPFEEMALTKDEIIHILSKTATSPKGS